MSQPSSFRRLKCPKCAASQLCGPEEMAARLRKGGTLRRETQPRLDLLVELFESAVENFACESCGATGLELNLVEDDFDTWPEAKACEVCKKPIPSERLEVFPDASRCAGCQDKEIVGQEEADYCPRCGAILQIRKVTSGVTKYQMWCPDCRR